MKIKDLTKEEDIRTLDNENNVRDKLGVQFIQPWSNMICKIKLQDDMFEELQKLYKCVMESKEKKSFGEQLVGQISEEPQVTMDILNKFPKWRGFCLQMSGEYVKSAMTQVLVASKNLETFNKEDLMTRITTMWFVNQKPHEYNPAHIHTNCKVSSVVYLQTPKNQVKGMKDHYQADGQITFINNSGTDNHFSNSQCSFEPKAGDMYIFPALQHHMVWPYRSTDPDDSRISLSFNMDYTTKSQLDAENKNHEMMYEQMKKHKESEMKDDKSVTDGDINKSG
jgi:uncharacterized protein (TIGR02466 family)